MGRKIFVTYKYSDSSVKDLPELKDTSARNYVNELQKIIDKNDHIYKGEEDDESLEEFKHSTVESKLRNKIYDSTISILLISKGMKEEGLSDEDQWIPWELSYALKEVSRNGRKSRPNAFLGVILPDEEGSTDYFIERDPEDGSLTYHIEDTFRIIRENMFNKKEQNPNRWEGTTIYDHSCRCSYIHCISWDTFITDFEKYMQIATEISECIEEYDIRKVV